MICTPYTLRFAVLLTVANSFLDAHTYLVRGGVFANLQTGNVIFFAIHLSERHWGDSLSRLWLMFAFIAGVVSSSHIKSGRVDKVVAQPLRWTMATQAAVLAGFGYTFWRVRVCENRARSPSQTNHIRPLCGAPSGRTVARCAKSGRSSRSWWLAGGVGCGIVRL